MTAPTMGRLVFFRLTAEQAETISRRRAKAAAGVIDLRDSLGNPVAVGSVVPMVITAVWANEYPPGGRLSEHAEGTFYESTWGVNGQAFLDGNDSLWVCSAPQHRELAGCWFWPPRE
jgi:hypothetical protein